VEAILEYGPIRRLLASEIISTTDEVRYQILYRGGETIVINPDQAWFWTPEWQAGELRVDEYIREGNYETYDTMEDFLNTLGG